MVMNMGEDAMEDFMEATPILDIEAVPVFAGRKIVVVVLGATLEPGKLHPLNTSLSPSP
jgi:hypothetical protein